MYSIAIHSLPNYKYSCTGHHHVQQREIIRVAIHKLERLLADCCANDPVIFCAQQSGEQFAVSYIVIGHKDDSPVAFRSRHIPSSAILSTAMDGLRDSILVDRGENPSSPRQRKGMA